MTKAQLLLVGGRYNIPNLLTVLYQKPDMIFLIPSGDSDSNDIDKFKELIKHLSKEKNVDKIKGVDTRLPEHCKVIPLDSVDAFETLQIREQCKKAFEAAKDAEWLCNVTPGTKIMGMAVAAEAEAHKHHCWYLDTKGERIIDLSGEKLSREIFYLSVEDYFDAYYYKLTKEISNNAESSQQKEEHEWLSFARDLGKDSSKLQASKEIKKILDNKPKEQSCYSGNVTDNAHSLLTEAQNIGLLQNLNVDSSRNARFNLDQTQYRFFNGTWLEVYVWHELKKAMKDDLDDVQWGYQFADRDKNTREADVVVTRKSVLYSIECKTGKKGKDPKTLRDITSLAKLVGENYVGKFLVTDLTKASKEDKSDKSGIPESFLATAEQNKIVVFTQKDLPDIGQKLAEKIIHSPYARI